MRHETHGLNEPETVGNPGNLNPAPLGPLSGNWRDDDPQAYEDDFQAADHRSEPWPTEKPPPGVPHPVKELKVPTRLIVRNITIGTIGGVIADPVLLLPADVNRKRLTLTAIIPGGGTFVFADSKAGVYDNGNAFPGYDDGIARGMATDLLLVEHTGPLWVYSTAASPCRVIAVAVTE